LAAVFSAVAMFANVGLLASTSTILQFWQIACTVSTSSAISMSQPCDTAEPAAAPRFVFLKQAPVTPLPHLGSTGSPNVFEYAVRSL
jgi:hypothetical protein